MKKDIISAGAAAGKDISIEKLLIGGDRKNKKIPKKKDNKNKK